MQESENLSKRLAEVEAKLSCVKNLMNFKEAMVYLGFSRAYLYNLCYKKKIPHHKPTDRKLFFFRDEIDEWVRKRVGSLQSAVGSQERKSKRTDVRGRKSEGKSAVFSPQSAVRN